MHSWSNILHAQRLFLYKLLDKHCTFKIKHKRHDQCQIFSAPNRHDLCLASILHAQRPSLLDKHCTFEIKQKRHDQCLEIFSAPNRHDQCLAVRYSVGYSADGDDGKPRRVDNGSLKIDCLRLGLTFRKPSLRDSIFTWRTRRNRVS